jgi:hypothetical protein
MGKRNKVTPEFKAFCVAHAPEYSYAEMASIANERFGMNASVRFIDNLYRRLKIRTGRLCRFQGKAEGATCVKSFGSIQKRKQFRYIKVGTKWVLLHRYLIEQATGRKLNSNDMIYFLDGDHLNCDIDNLFLTTCGTLARASKKGYLASKNPDVVKAGLILAELEGKIKKIA